MKKFLNLLSGLFFMILTAGVVNSATIVDTGTKGINYGFNFYQYQCPAAEFTIGEKYTITDIESWLWKQDLSGLGINPDESYHTVTVTLYADGGEVPGNFKYSGTFDTNIGTVGTGDWYGIHGVSWELDIGTYWVSFTEATMWTGAWIGEAVTQLGNEAISDNSGSTWIEYDNFAMPLRIQGNAAAVPIPSAISLLGLGLLAIAGVRRKQ
ncbi:MAG: hypothetical protein K8S13_03215 [Desulfobacula sp.]|uniref:hypothetical protein n=1 Tax=Desulfobacula sp. TaxID=2593537 RepID=UPI0025B84592|nr:hypothetical protein [Desulfobacula sp.]MCD4718854.1 hypothetical protein [Desulfobacula sp.]